MKKETLRCFEDRDKKLLILVFTSVFGFGLAAHAYSFFNTIFSHDSMFVLADYAQWQIELGRFLQPLYILLRGNLSTPFLFGLCALVWLSLAAYLIVKLLNIQSAMTIVLSCGVLVTNASFTLSNATYLPWIDIYMVANLLAVISVWIFEKSKYGFLWGVVPLILSLALYQSYIQVAVILLLILMVQKLLDGDKPADVFISGIKAVAMLILALVCYWAILQLVLRITGLGVTSRYNGLSGIGDYGGYSIVKLLLYTVGYTAFTFINPEANAKLLVILINVVVIGTAVVFLFRAARKNALNKASVALLILVLILMPFGVDCVYFIAKGNVHWLMKYSFYFLYIFAMLIFDRAPERIREGRPNRPSWVKLITSVLIAIVLWDNVIYANQLYLKKDLEYQSTNLFMNRVVDRIEQTEGYVPGQTRVVFIGDVDQTALLPDHEGFDHFQGTGATYSSSITYYQTLEVYFKQVLGYPVNMLGETEALAYAELAQVEQMPLFPARDSIGIVDDVLVVKIATIQAPNDSSSVDGMETLTGSSGILDAIENFVKRLLGGYQTS